MQTIPIKTIAQNKPASLESNLILNSAKLTTSLKQSDVAYHFHSMIKPTGSQCNLDCRYCFYLHKQDLLEQPKRPRMSEGLLELHIKQYIEAQTVSEVVFTWQGGEPMLAGLVFFEKVIEYQQRYKKPNQVILNDLQTNGVMLDDKWCEFLVKHKFLVGISIDGPAEFHNKHRYTKTQTPTHGRVMDAVHLLRKHHITYNALCVVNRDNAKAPLEVYRFIRDEVKPQIIQFIPCIEMTDFTDVAPKFWPKERLPKLGSLAAKPGNDDSVVTQWTVDPEDWGTFLTQIWDEWFKHDFGDVFVDQFENIISLMFGYGAQKCVNAKNCGKALAVEHNGDVFSCDHYVYPEYKLGNIKESHEGDMAYSIKQEQFGLAKSESLPKYCRECFFIGVCWGECPKNRFILTPDGQEGLNYLCSGLRKFYAKAYQAYPVLQQKLSI